MFCFVNIAAFSFAQTSNTLPTVGRIGIGTTTPTAKLEVIGRTAMKGRVQIDSLVIIKDSLLVRKRLTVGQNIKVTGKSVFVDKAKFKNNINVLGSAKIKNKLIVDSLARFKSKLVVEGLTKMKGNAIVLGNLKLPNLSTTNNTSFFLTSNANGRVGSLNRAGLTTIIYQPPQTCRTDQNGNILSVWKQTPHPTYGILYTGIDCPTRVGIGTDNPITTLDVIGKSYTSSTMGLGIVPTNQYQLNIKSTLKTAGILLFNDLPPSFPITTPRYGIKNVVNKDKLIAYSVTREATNQDVFRVLGDGTVSWYRSWNFNTNNSIRCRWTNYHACRSSGRFYSYC